MIVLGITGSIGMGKTTIASMLKIYDIPVHDSDLVVKHLYEKNISLKKEIKKEWPSVIERINDIEIINKKKLSEIIFKEENCKAKLEKMIHPLVKKDRDMFLEKHSSSKILALDVPLLYETGMDRICDYIFLALTSEKNQRKRVLTRENMTNKKFLLIKQHQWTDKEKKLLKPFIITTSYGKLVSFFLISFFLLKILFKEKALKI